MGRCCIGASDYSRSIYSYDDVPDDMNLDHFSLKHDEAYILPTLREIREINPDLFLHGHPVESSGLDEDLSEQLLEAEPRRTISTPTPIRFGSCPTGR